MNSSVTEFLIGLGDSSFIAGFATTFLAQYLPYLLAVAFFVLLIWHDDWRDRASLFLFTVFATALSKGLFAGSIKFFFDTPRPFEVMDIVPLADAGGSAFPSGHASFFFALALSIFLFNRKWGYWFVALAFLNGTARVAAGIHWAGDIIGGILVAVASCGISYLLLSDYLSGIIQDDNSQV